MCTQMKSKGLGCVQGAGRRTKVDADKVKVATSSSLHTTMTKDFYLLEVYDQVPCCRLLTLPLKT